MSHNRIIFKKSDKYLLYSSRSFSNFFTWMAFTLSMSRSSTVWVMAFVVWISFPSFFWANSISCCRSSEIWASAIRMKLQNLLLNYNKFRISPFSATSDCTLPIWNLSNAICSFAFSFASKSSLILMPAKNTDATSK